MSQCQLRVFCCFGFRKVTQEIYLELDETKTQPPIPDTYMESKGEKKGSHDASTPCGGTTPPLAARGHGVGPTGASDHRTSTYLYPPDAKTLK